MQTVDGLQCTSFGIRQDVPYQIWEAISSANQAPIPIWVIRLLNNKVRYYTLNYLQCYVYYLSPSFIITRLGFIKTLLLLIILLLLVKLYPKLKLPLLSLILLYPLFMIFELHSGNFKF